MCKKIFVVLFVLFLGSSSVHATSVKPVNIEVLTQLSQYIVKAEVVGIQTEVDEYESGSLVTYYTLKVDDWIKGGPLSDDNIIVIKQLADGDYANAEGVKLRQRLFFPQYQKNRSYVFFLPKPHHVTGLLAPIGLWQGVFDVEYDAEGNAVLPQLKSPRRAGILGKGLKKGSKNKFASLKGSSGEGKDTSYLSFKSMVKALVKPE
ncbi:MAG: hypothetical protein HQM16_07275 [Deltaproteobacteria bacterium]|nr:hypothetical protein [Deltaproteobacteria bacterium]